MINQLISVGLAVLYCVHCR